MRPLQSLGSTDRNRRNRIALQRIVYCRPTPQCPRPPAPRRPGLPDPQTPRRHHPLPRRLDDFGRTLLHRSQNAGVQPPHGSRKLWHLLRQQNRQHHGARGCGQDGGRRRSGALAETQRATPTRGRS